MQNSEIHKSKLSTRSMRILKSTHHMPVIFRSIVDLKEDTTLLSSFEGKQDSLLQPFYREYCYKYVVISLYCLSSITNSIVWVITNPISYQLESYYSASKNIIDLTAVVFQIMYIPFTFLSIYVLDYYGIQKAMLFANILTILGSSLKLLINYNFYFLVIGNSVAAIAQSFILNAITQISFQWLKPSNRIIGTSVMALANTVGIGIGYVFPIFFVDAQLQSIDVGRQQVFNMLYYSNYIILFINILAIIFIREKPPTPPSVQSVSQKISLVQSTKMLFIDPNFIVFSIAYGIVVGTINSLGTILEQIIEPFGFTSDDSSIASVFLILAGILGSAFYVYLFDLTQNYKMLLMVNSFSLAVFLAVSMLSFYFNQYKMIFFIAVGLIGFNVLPCIALGSELAAEISAPVGEAYSCGYIGISGSIFTLLIVFPLNYLISRKTQRDNYIVMAILILINLVATVIMGFVKQYLKRAQKEIADEIQQSQYQG